MNGISGCDECPIRLPILDKERYFNFFIEFPEDTVKCSHIIIVISIPPSISIN